MPGELSRPLLLEHPVVRLWTHSAIQRSVSMFGKSRRPWAERWWHAPAHCRSPRAWWTATYALQPYCWSRITPPTASIQKVRAVWRISTSPVCVGTANARRMPPAAPSVAIRRAMIRSDRTDQMDIRREVIGMAAIHPGINALHGLLQEHGVGGGFEIPLRPLNNRRWPFLNVVMGTIPRWTPSSP
jgi:hypothetical protein